MSITFDKTQHFTIYEMFYFKTNILKQNISPNVTSEVIDMLGVDFGESYTL